MFCRAGNKYMPERKRSRPNFLFRERTFLFRDRIVVWPSVARSDSPDRGKEQSSRGKGRGRDLFNRGYTCFMPYTHTVLFIILRMTFLNPLDLQFLTISSYVFLFLWSQNPLCFFTFTIPSPPCNIYYFRVENFLMV